MNNFKNKKGITLVSLVITIVIMLILAGVAISLVIGDNGLFKKATSSAEKYKVASDKETQELNNSVDEIKSLSKETGTYKRNELEYPILTDKGVMNVKYVSDSDEEDYYYKFDENVVPSAEDALLKEAYDGDDSTYAEGRFKKLLIDKSALGKNIRTLWQVVPEKSAWRVITICDANGNIIKYSPNFVSELTEYVLKIPENASYILMGYSPSRCYDISITTTQEDE